MELQGKIIVAMDPRSGVSKTSGNEWKSQSFVLETHDQYPRKMVFDVFGADRIAQFNIQPGGEYIVQFDIDAHEYNGRWFNNIRAYAVRPIAAAMANTSVSSTATTTASTLADTPVMNSDGDSTDDLPF